jgi:CDP-glycerol glycerophosphotransferase (TagB/SpsB family)
MVQDGLYDLEFNKDDRLKIRTYNRAKFMLNLPSQLILFLINNNSLKYKLKTIYFELRYGKKGKRTVHGQGESTKIAVFGESTKDFLVSLGVNPKKIEITGSPKFDSLYLINNNKSIKKDNNKIILVITQPLVENGMWTSDQRAVFIKSILESTKNINNVDLILKLHHHENKKDYEKILKNLYKNVKIYDNYPLHELIHSSDIAITLYSTAGLEAMILKKPLIILNLFKNNLPTVFKGMNVININNKEDIENTIKTYLYDSDKINKLIESYKDLYYHTYKIDGKSAIRIANLINEMVN